MVIYFAAPSRENLAMTITSSHCFIVFLLAFKKNCRSKSIPGAHQVGLGFRNEISPRAGLLRVREFSMAEVKFSHFYPGL